LANPPFSIIRVFNSQPHGFRGNTAAVVLMEKPWSEIRMQELAADFNQPATTFLWPAGANADAEIDLCGHGSLAAIAYLSKNPGVDAITLLYGRGSLQGERVSGESCSITLEAIPVISQEAVPKRLATALGIPLSAYFTTNNKHIVLVNNEQDLKCMDPDFAQLRKIEAFGYAVTAPGDEIDFASRTLVPHVQQLEDHATGSSHAALAPFWAERLNKSTLTAHQLSPRGGRFICEVAQGQVHLKGNFEIMAEGQLKGL
jgi:PhzF family phenazine biosynthesis protein